MLLVAHDRRSVTAVVRDQSRWTVTDHVDGDVIALARPALVLPVRDIYRPLDPIA